MIDAATKERLKERAREVAERARRREQFDARRGRETAPFDGPHYRVEVGWNNRPHRVVHKRLGTIRGNFGRLTDANAVASALDAAEPARAPARLRAQAAAAYAALFTLSAAAFLRRLLP